MDTCLPHVVGPGPAISDAISRTDLHTISLRDMSSHPPKSFKEKSLRRRALDTLKNVFASPSTPLLSSQRLRDLPASSVELRPPPPAFPRSPSQSILLQPASDQAPIAVEQVTATPSVHKSPTLTVTKPDAQQASKPESRAKDKVKQAGKTAWIALKLALEVLQKSSDVFPPLQSAVAGFSGCLSIVEVRRDHALAAKWHD